MTHERHDAPGSPAALDPALIIGRSHLATLLFGRTMPALKQARAPDAPSALDKQRLLRYLEHEAAALPDALVVDHDEPDWPTRVVVAPEVEALIARAVAHVVAAREGDD